MINLPEIVIAIHADMPEIEPLLNYDALKLLGKYMRDAREPDRLKKEKLERDIARLFKKHWRNQQDIIIQRLEMMRMKTLPPTVLDSLMDDNEEYDWLLMALAKLIATGVITGVSGFGEGVTIGIDWTLTNDRAAKWALDYAGELIKDVDTTTRTVVGSIIDDFISTPGMTIGDVIDRLPFTEARSMRIAITETTRAFAQGAKLAGEDLMAQYPDIRVVKTWFTNNDDRVCDICGPNNEAQVEMTDVFPSGDSEPPAHIGCRCWMASRTDILAGNT